MDSLTPLFRFHNIRPLFIQSTNDFVFIVVKRALPREVFNQIVTTLGREFLVLIEATPMKLLKQFISTSRVNSNDFRITKEGSNYVIYIRNSEVRKVRGRSFKRWNFLISYLQTLPDNPRALIRSLNTL